MRAILSAALMCLWTAAMPAAADRLSLVIGNDTYESLPVLQKARNDARAVAEALTGLGFAVTHLADADRRTMTRALSDLAGAIAPGDEVLFYFAGHGVEVAGRNYLLPADAPAARPGDEAFLTAESVAVDDVLGTLQARGALVTVLILDACRNNPFPRDGTRSAGGLQGLAPIAAPEGAFILFSAGTGQTALDALGPRDGDPNSVFTRALLPLLQVPGVPVQNIARALKAEVEATAASVNHKQRPAYYDELTGDFVLNAGASRSAVALDGAPAPEAVARPAADPCDAAARDWQTVSGLGDPALMRSFATTHAGCALFARAAEQRAQELGQDLGKAPGTAAPITGTPEPKPIAAPIPQPIPEPIVETTYKIKMGVSEGHMNARSGPGTMHPILFEVKQGTGGLRVSDCRKPDPGGGKSDWCLVTWGDRQGWIAKTGLVPE